MSNAETFIGQRSPRNGREWECQCARCGSSCGWEDCWNCAGDGYSHHDCGEDCCCCLYPEDNVVCDVCRGRGGWHFCLSSEKWCEANPVEGREDIPCGTLEWYTFDLNPTESDA